MSLEDREEVEEVFSRSSSALWLTRNQAAHMVGISLTNFNTTILPHLEPESIREDVVPVRVHAKSVVDVWVKLQVERYTGGDMENFKNASSPNLERKRKIEADEAEVDFAIKVGKLISVDDWQQRISGRFWDLLRAQGEVIKRNFGNEGVRIHNQFVKDIENALLSG